MKELVSGLKHIPLGKARNLILLDTCFIIALAEHENRMREALSVKNIATTSFNIEELLKVEHKLGHEQKKRLREFLKAGSLKIVEVDVHPGEWEAEREFVRSIDNELLKKIPDASDAVLLAVAIKTHSSVFTKDKHHLFTTILENFVKEYDIKVYKEISDLIRLFGN